MDQNIKLIGTGVAGVLLSMLCCFTPALVVLLTALGLTAFVAKLDYVLVPEFCSHEKGARDKGQIHCGENVDARISARQGCGEIGVEIKRKPAHQHNRETDIVARLRCRPVEDGAAERTFCSVRQVLESLFS